MQRSYSSNSFENKQNCSFRPQFDSVFESQHLENSFSSTSSGHMRRVCSTGDLQKCDVFKSIICGENISNGGSNFKVGKYSAEERKERIDRYRAKRGQRNFNRTIKYACRKTLADNRPRIRGRFARNDEAERFLKLHCFIDMKMKMIFGDKGISQRGLFFNSFGPTQYPNYSY
ncbi:hypothetical protein ACJIZ3_008206 [Penstemon smallii]|uniref:CCT domain-containing protein n=1 Tax=Penstemon smallii TaxID=265156 RepID=A0ABD3TAA2_9LAMI